MAVSGDRRSWEIPASIEVGPNGRKLIRLPVGQTKVQLPFPQVPQSGRKLVHGAFDLFQHAPADKPIDDDQRPHQTRKGKPSGNQFGTVNLPLEILHGGKPLLQQPQPGQPVGQQGKQQICQKRQGKHQNMGPEQSFFHRHKERPPKINGFFLSIPQPRGKLHRNAKKGSHLSVTALEMLFRD